MHCSLVKYFGSYQLCCRRILNVVRTTFAILVVFLSGAGLMFLVGTRKEHNSMINSNANNCNLNNCTIANLNLNDCVCPLGPYNPIYAPELPLYPFYRQGSNHYERIFTNYSDHFDKSNLHRHSYRHKIDHSPRCLTKSLSYAANIDRTSYQHLKGVCNQPDYVRCTLPRSKRGVLRPSKSVPEGLARWDYCRRPIVRNIQVIEQITTSV